MQQHIDNLTVQFVVFMSIVVSIGLILIGMLCVALNCMRSLRKTHEAQLDDILYYMKLIEKRTADVYYLTSQRYHYNNNNATLATAPGPSCVAYRGLSSSNTKSSTENETLVHNDDNDDGFVHVAPTMTATNGFNKHKQDLYRLFEKKSGPRDNAHVVKSQSLNEAYSSQSLTTHVGLMMQKNANVNNNNNNNKYNIERREYKSRLEQQHMKRSKSLDVDNETYSNVCSTYRKQYNLKRIEEQYYPEPVKSSTTNEIYEFIETQPLNRARLIGNFQSTPTPSTTSSYAGYDEDVFTDNP